MTLEQTGRAYFGDHLQSQDLQQTLSHPLAQHLKRLNLIRRQIPALQKGQMLQVNEWGSGMSFVRDDAASGSYAVVALAASVDQEVVVRQVKSGTYRDAVTGREVVVTDGELRLSVRAHSAAIYVRNGAGKIGADGVFLR